MRLRLASFAAVIALQSLPLAAQPYTLFIFEDADQLALRSAASEAGKAYWSGYDTFGKALAAADVLRGGSALSTGAAVAIVPSGVATDETQAASAREGRTLGGYFQIDVATDAEAVAWAKKVPVAGVGIVEVRSGYPVPGSSM